MSAHVAQKKGGCVRKARGKTTAYSFSPQYYGPFFEKMSPKVVEIFAWSLLGAEYTNIFTEILRQVC